MTSTLKSAGKGLLAISATCALIAALGAQPAAARPLADVDPAWSDVVSEQISLAGMDLSRADHRRKLDGRIRSASRRVCETQPYARTAISDQKCRRDAIEGAQSQMASLVNRAERLAAGGMPAEVNTVLTVIAPGSE